jgi:hypothetical protein
MSRHSRARKTARKADSKVSPRILQSAKAESAAPREASQASKARPKNTTRTLSDGGLYWEEDGGAFWVTGAVVRDVREVMARESALDLQKASSPTKRRSTKRRES